MTPIATAHARFSRTHPFIGTADGPERVCADGVGRFRDYIGGVSIYAHPEFGTHLIYGAIRAKWIALGRERARHC